MDKTTDTPCESIVPLPGAVALPPLPWDLDTTNARLTIPIKVGVLVDALHRWGREVYARAQQAALESPACTCPSGDGSLRWPCMQHPPEAARAGASARAELVELLKAIRPSYGAVGSRDVDVAAQQRRIDRAIELLSASIDGEKGGAA